MWIRKCECTSNICDKCKKYSEYASKEFKKKKKSVINEKGGHYNWFTNHSWDIVWVIC